jgi:putative transposase
LGILISFRNGARTAQATRSHDTFRWAVWCGLFYYDLLSAARKKSACHDRTATVLFDTARIYHESGRWNLNLLLLMPDHLHALIGIDGRDSLSQLIRDYKRITAKLSGVEWQRNFFDHRLRHDESLTEKFAYVRQNPVRAGLVQTEGDWPYVFIPRSEFRR